MGEWKLTVVEESRPAWQMWLPRVAAAVVFLFLGTDKFAAQSQWIGIFEQIGFGQWFRYLTGALQVSGAVLVLIPRTFPIGILVLACTMLGAMAAWIFFLGAPFNALFPGLILGGLLIVGGEDLVGLLQAPEAEIDGGRLQTDCTNPPGGDGPAYALRQNTGRASGISRILTKPFPSSSRTARQA